MNAKKEKLLNDTYQKWMQAGLYDLPLDKINEFIDPKIMGYGTAIDEKVLSISEYKQLINRQREQAVGIEMVPKITSVFRSVTNKEDAAIFVDEIKVQMIIDSEKHELFLRITTLLEYIDSNWIVVHWHGSIPTETTAEADAWLVNEWKRKNEELQKLVDEKTSELLNKNRELEIEAGLEKVRTVAMGMRDPADMLDVCKTISDQLEMLNIKDIRNVQTAIINEQKGTYINYQYFAAYNKGAIEETEYDKHPKVLAMVQEMKRSTNAIFSGRMIGKDLEVFRDYRKNDNQFPDPLLDEATAVYYNFYSIGLGGLGITTYNPLPQTGLEIFKRFHKVFSLAYRRFIDIEKAEAQAREAQIEAALERVRSRSMGMQKSEELKEVIRVVYEQFVHLKINVDHAGFVVDYTPRGDWHFWIADEQDIPSKITHPYFESVWANQFNETKEKGADFFATNLNFEEKNEFYNELLSYVPGLPEASKKFYLSCPGLAGSTVLFDNVSLYIENFSGIPYVDEENKILMRFGKVFQQTYTRFLDLQKAEAQAREAQIETALERVRSKAMAMHNSSDLAITVDTFFSELNALKVTPHRCGVGIINAETRIVDVLATSATHENEIKKITGNLKLSGHPVLDNIFENWKLQKEYHPVLNGIEILEYYKVMNPQVTFPDFAKDETQYGYYFFFKEGGVFAWTDKELSDGDLQIFRKYTSVLSLTYRRYMDLKDAEAQTREAQIEASLERVRSKAMAMHKSDDLTPAVATVFSELDRLSFRTVRCGIGIFNDLSEKVDVWTTSSDDKSGSVNLSGNELLEGHPLLEGIFKAWKLQKDYSYVLEGKDLLDYYRVTSNSNLPVAAPKIALETTKQYYHCIMFPSGGLFAFRESEFSTEAKNLMRRFADVFQLTFTRHLDLKKAEAQNKIIKAENERKTKELEEARQLQLAMLPRELPEVSNLDVAVYMKTATEVGGDYYDFNVDTNGTLTVLVGDATGHGMMSGMMVSIMKSFFISHKSNIELKQFFEDANNSIKDMQLGRLMMSFMGVQITSEKVIATNAGMPSLIYFRNKSQKAGEFVSNSLPLGAMKETKYSLKEIYYEKDDTLLLMSDGFGELKNENNEQYGYPRIIKEFKSVVQKSSNEIVDHLKKSAFEWMNGTEPDDDLTFVVIKVK